MKIRENRFLKSYNARLLHYDECKYWKYRSEVVNPNSKKSLLKRMLWLKYIKKCDYFNCASLATNLGSGAVFKGVPNLPHHLNGIVVGYDVTIGVNCTIFHRVTIAHGGNTFIGDNVILGTGSFISPGVKIGNNAIVGANAVVTHDVPDNCIVAGVPAKVIGKRKE